METTKRMGYKKGKKTGGEKGKWGYALSLDFGDIDATCHTPNPAHGSTPRK